MTPIEIEFMLQSFQKMYDMFYKAVTELKSGSGQLVYRNESEAYKKSGFQRTYWERIKHRVPYVEIPSDGEQKRVYPVKALNKWIEKNTVYPDGK